MCLCIGICAIIVMMSPWYHEKCISVTNSGKMHDAWNNFPNFIYGIANNNSLIYLKGDSLHYSAVSSMVGKVCTTGGHSVLVLLFPVDYLH